MCSFASGNHGKPFACFGLVGMCASCGWAPLIVKRVSYVSSPVLSSSRLRFFVINDSIFKIFKAALVSSGWCFGVWWERLRSGHGGINPACYLLFPFKINIYLQVLLVYFGFSIRQNYWSYSLMWYFSSSRVASWFSMQMTLLTCRKAMNKDRRKFHQSSCWDTLSIF